MSNRCLVGASLERNPPVRSDLSPKDLAEVIGVSESSLKRWVDEGKIQAARTAGGHRRIALHEAIRFIRQNNSSVVRPEMLGLEELSNSSLSDVVSGGADAALLDALCAGDANRARGLILAFLIKTRSIAEVCDGPLTHAMHRIGELWLHSDRGILVENRATEICLEALHQIRQTLTPPAPNAPVAIGCAPESDEHSLGTLMAATVLLESGYRDINLGARTPLSAIEGAIREHRPLLVWLSACSTEGRNSLWPQLERITKCAGEVGAKVVVGGYATIGQQPPPGIALNMVVTLAELAAVGRTVRAQAAREPHTNRLHRR